MKTTKLSRAIKLILAAQVGASAMAIAPVSGAQQMPVQPQSVVMPQQGAVSYPQQRTYVVQQQQPQMMYQQAAPQQQQIMYQQAAPQQPQMMYQQTAPQQPQVMYQQAAPQQPQVMYQQAAPQQPQMMYQQAAPQQPQMMYQQTAPQQPQVMYQQAAPQQPQIMYQQAAPQQPVMYAQSQGSAQSGQPMMYPQPVMQPQANGYPQGALMYPQSAAMYAQGVQYGNAVMQAPGAAPGLQAGTIPQGMVMYQQGAAPVQQAPMVVYQNGVPMHYPGGVVYGYSGQVPQGAVLYQGGAALQPVAANITAAGAGKVIVPTSVVPGSVGAADEVLAERPRLQTGSLSKLNISASNRPVQTLSSDALGKVNAVNVESALNTLPQLVPGADRTSNNPGNGRASADIRGLGTSRTAVLVNGRPFVPATAGGTVDLNAIPPALIKQVDVATGGSSVAYGSGAVAGVVNFVMDENFQGAELNVSHQSSANQDAGLSSVDLTLGSAFADGRGNIAVSVGGSEREGLFHGDREFSAFTQSDSSDSDGNPVLIAGGSTGVPGTSVFSGSLGSYSPETFGVTFDPNGEIRPFQSGEQNDFYNFAPVNYLQLPQTRRHATAIANFDIADSLELYGLGMYSETETISQLASTPIFQSVTSFTVDGSPFLTPFSQQVLSDALGDGIDSDGDGIDDTASAFLRRRLLESGPRRSTLNSTSEYAQAGIRGEIGEALEYDIYASRAEVSSVATQEGNVSRSRFQQSLLLDLQADPNGGVCQQTTSDTTVVACTPANIFGEGNISPEAVEFLAAGVAIESKSIQSIYAARLTAKLGSLPGGEARVTVGAEHRENSYGSQFVLTNLAGSGDQAGFNGGPDLQGATSSESIYGDIYLPLIANADGAELVDLELGYRLTDYTTSPGVASYGANASWAPSETFRVRAGYNRAHRAPDIGELFSPQEEGFPGASDPCSASGAPPGGLSPEQVAICVATGVPVELVGSTFLNPPGGQVRAIGGGNMDLQEEQADTYSVGLEFVVPVGEEGRLHAGADYFSIDGSQGIAAFGGGAANVLNTCYDDSQSSAEAPSVFCDVINRSPDGTIHSVELTNQNVALFEVDGVDLFAGVSLPALGGTVGVDFNGTVLSTHRFTAYQGADPIECAGRFGNLCGEPLPSYSHRVTAGWSNEYLAASLVWRHVGAVEDDDDSTTYAREKFSARDYLDAELNLNLANSIGLAIGVQNLTDVAPPIAGDNQEQANTFPATYDVFGRTYFVRLSGSSSLDGK